MSPEMGLQITHSLSPRAIRSPTPFAPSFAATTADQPPPTNVFRRRPTTHLLTTGSKTRKKNPHFLYHKIHKKKEPHFLYHTNPHRRRRDFQPPGCGWSAGKLNHRHHASPQ
ncbi:hypothetical protein Hanom_Chr00s005326g01728741 [Helianthus anomalus]